MIKLMLEANLYCVTFIYMLHLSPTSKQTKIGVNAICTDILYEAVCLQESADYFTLMI